MKMCANVIGYIIINSIRTSEPSMNVYFVCYFKIWITFWIDRLYLYNWLRITYIMFKETYLNCSIVLQMHMSYFSFQPVLHDWCNKGCGMCYPVYGMVHIKEPLLLIGKNSPYGGSRYPLTIPPPPPKKKRGEKKDFPNLTDFLV